MARISRFFFSALLVVASFWLILHQFPDIAESESTANNVAVEAPTDSALDENAPDPDKLKEAGRALDRAAELKDSNGDDSTKSNDSKESETNENKGELQGPQDTRFAKGQPKEDARLSASGQNLDRVSFSPASLRVEAESSQEIAAESVKPQGGKFVSIPPIEMDAIGVRPGPDGRVIGVMPARAVSHDE